MYCKLQYFFYYNQTYKYFKKHSINNDDVFLYINITNY